MNYGLKTIKIGEFYICNPRISGWGELLVAEVLTKNKSSVVYKKYYLNRETGLNTNNMIQVTETLEEFKKDFRGFKISDKKSIFYDLFK